MAHHRSRALLLPSLDSLEEDKGAEREEEDYAGDGEETGAESAKCVFHASGQEGIYICVG